MRTASGRRSEGPASPLLKAESASVIAASSSCEGEAVSSNIDMKLPPLTPPHGAEGEEQDADAGKTGKERQRVDALQNRLAGHADHHAIVVGDADLAAHRQDRRHADFAIRIGDT